MIGVSRPIVKHSLAEVGGHSFDVKKAFYCFHRAPAGGSRYSQRPDTPSTSSNMSTPRRSACALSTVARSLVRPKAARMLLSTKRPVIYAGGGVIQARAPSN